ncbi:MAG: galactokinase [Candidatus Sumerlaea chitinivorans]|uniref:Galactokinase n=1 Tax=Sumerlaea chitinivorans TaxID=2250252 RepID=A0A2Z4YB12_SUMC1|nr:Galactokinase [Candidatus Sumerlaea chitinivorans]MCX7964990.1 galactokinase [Candidatus Sumerlaea chitinivorans]
MIAPLTQVEGFIKVFGSPPRWASFAPGRVNLIGEHTDYNGGRVMPCAVHLGVTMLAQPASGDAARIVTCAPNGTSPLPQSSEFVWPQGVSAESLFDQPPRWKNYLLAVAVVLRENGIEVPALDVLIVSDLPTGAGLSSSAALELAYAYLVTSIVGAHVDLRQLALLCQRAEHSPGVGVRCGIMDQFASALGHDGQLLFLDCDSLDYEYVPFDSGQYLLAILDSRVPRELAGSAYNRRRQECEEALEMLRAYTGRPLRNLCEVSRAELDAVRGVFPTTLWRRALHVVEEHARVFAMAEALRAGKWQEAGQILCASHESLRNYFEVSCPELDELVEIAMSVNGVLGARLTGAGFGGCVIALVEQQAFHALVEAATQHYYEPKGIASATFATKPSYGPVFETLG